MSNLIRTHFLFLISLMLTGCSFFSPVPQPTTYRVDSIPYVFAAAQRPTSILLVMPPEASSTYNTSEMAYTKCLYQISYFAKNSWIDTPSQMLHPLIVETLRKTKHFAAINTSQALGSYEYLVNTHILKFEQDFTRSPSVFRLQIRVQIVKAAKNRVIASRNILVEEPMSQNSPYNGVVAANGATKVALEELARFAVRVIP